MCGALTEAPESQDAPCAFATAPPGPGSPQTLTAGLRPFPRGGRRVQRRPPAVFAALSRRPPGRRVPSVLSGGGGAVQPGSWLIRQARTG